MHSSDYFPLLRKIADDAVVIVMKKNIEIKDNDLREIYLLLEEINHLFHQPLYYEDKEMVKKFAKKHYKTIHKLYYETFWNYLSEDVKNELINR